MVLVCPRPLAGQADPEGQEAASGGVLVTGVVQSHETGDPIYGAAVSLMSGPSGTQGRGTRITDDDGRFRFRDVPPGSYRISVTVLGYRSMRDTIQVQEDEDLGLLLPLSPEPIPLEPIIVAPWRPPKPYRMGYEGRRRFGSGFVVTREEIEKRQPRFLTEVLNRVPGGIVVATPPHGYTLRLRGLCLPGVWIDGVRVASVESIDQLLAPLDVETVEVYHGFELPVEFGVDPCGGVLIWTRMGQFREPDPDAPPIKDLRRPLLITAGLILLTFFTVR